MRQFAPLLALLASAALAACASHRALPPAEPQPGVAPLSLRLESTRFHLFSSVRDDVAVERVFVRPGEPPLVVATSLAPVPGAFTGGPSGWRFAPLEAADVEGDGRRASGATAVRLFRELLFDPADPRRAWGRRAGVLTCTDDGGESFRACTPAKAPVEALEPGADGTLWAAGGGAVFVSVDGGREWARRPVRVPGLGEDLRVRVRSLVPDAKDARTLIVSLRGDPGAGAGIAGLIDGSSDEAWAARSFLDDATTLPRTISFGQGHQTGLVSHDGGATWRRIGLQLDAWLVRVRGSLWAVAADPMLEAAALVRRNPELVAALAVQLRGVRVETGGLRGALAFPGRDKLLAGSTLATPVFRSDDGGETWSRVLAPEPAIAAALRLSVDRQRAATEGLVDAAAPEQRRGGREGGRGEGGRGEGGEGGGGGGMGPGGGGGGGRGGGGRGGGRMGGGRGMGGGGSRAGGGERRPGPRFIPVEALLAYLDPPRLLARFNSGLPLTGLASTGSDRALIAWAPTEALWNKLADAAVAASDAEGEISLGPGLPQRDPALQPFELLRSSDGGASWTALSGIDALTSAAAPGPAGTIAYPESVAASAQEEWVVLSAHDRAGHLWRQAFHRAP